MQNITVETNDYAGNKNITILSVKGFLDTTTAPELEKHLKHALLDKKFNLIVELKDVDYISSAGWGIFISELKRIRTAKGDLVLSGMKPEVMEIFELLEFDSIMSSFANLESAALKAFANLPKTLRAVKGRKSALVPLEMVPQGLDAPTLADLPVLVPSSPSTLPAPHRGFGQALRTVFRSFRKK